MAGDKPFFLDRPLFRTLTVVVLTLAVLALAYRTFSLRQNLRFVTGKCELLSGEVERLRALVDKSRTFPGLTGGDIDALKARGLADPEADLKADLMKHPELIRHPGVAGGTMRFQAPEVIRVLSPRWVLAEFDDGHVAGRMLLSYAVADGKISWRVLDSYVE